MSESTNNSMETVSFRRFLSYIYAYEDDTKLRNVGFAKVEVRPPRVRIQVTVSGILQKGGRPMELCLVDGNLQRVPVGQLILQNGRGDYRGSTGIENMWDSGLAFSQVYGICLQGAGNRRHYYMTLWREAARPVRPVCRPGDSRIIVIPSGEKGKMHAAEIGHEAETKNEAEAADKVEVKSEAGTVNEVEVNRKAEAVGKAEGEKRTEVVYKEESKAASMDETERKDESQSGEESRWKAVSVDKVMAGNREMEGEEERRIKTEGEFTEAGDEAEGIENAENVEMADTAAEEFQEELESASELVREQPSGETLHKADVSSRCDSEDSPAAAGRSRRQNIKERNGDKSLELWKRFCTRYPHVDIRPFYPDDGKPGDSFMRMGKVCEVIRIRPNDIGRLPRNNWILAHNSFLQNAYNHYHQLILFRVENRGISSYPENRWFIGLPGENTDQETLVADVFGFKKYLKCKNGGFWYTEIMLG
ncbi:MAG: hypothetical protein PUG60_14435 [Lachnospiraceae bacterium]|nr:hypothetical protein [Lachnospiraceae bacterium]